VNQSVTQLKNKALVSIIAVPDLLYQGSLITADIYWPLEVYTKVALIYFVPLLPTMRSLMWWNTGCSNPGNRTAEPSELLDDAGILRLLAHT
jgi:ABC-type amino acid transport system permease subunit